MDPTTNETQHDFQSHIWSEPLVAGLMGSWDPGGSGTKCTTMATIGPPVMQNQNKLTEQNELVLRDLCAVPVGLCHAVKGGVFVLESMELLSPNVRVVCTNAGCDYGGPVHRSCLDRWSSCCELRCRMLASAPTSPTSPTTISSPGMRTEGASNAMLDGLLALYRCPQCGECSLCRMMINQLGKSVPTPSDPHANIIGAMQYVNQHTTPTGVNLQHGSQTFGPGNVPSSTALATAAAAALASHTANSAVLADEDRFGTDMPMDRRKRTSWHNAWSHSLNSPGPLAQYQINQQTQIMRRLSLRCANSTGNTSSGSTSGFGSSALGSSFSTAADTSFESSRRSSRNNCGSEIGEVFRSVQPITELAGAEDGSIGNWSGMPSPATATAPRALRGAGPSLSTRHSVGGSECTRTEFGPTFFDPVLQTNSPGSDLCEDNQSLYETGSTVHTAPGSARRHHSTSCVSTGKGPSFWPTDPTPGTKSRPTDSHETQKRKVVSRKGNIFKPRQDFTVFKSLPAYKRNAYFIQMDDDSCTGNEDTRAFLLAQLTNHRISEVSCLACHQSLVVYDHFPVVDGIFFISPVCHRSVNPTSGQVVSGLRVTWNMNGVSNVFQPPKVPGANTDLDEGNQNLVHKLIGSGRSVVPPPGCLGPRQQVAGNHGAVDGNAPSHHHHHHYHQHPNSGPGRHGPSGAGRQERYLHALCMKCIHHEDDSTAAGTGGIYCRSCHQPWSGATLLVGGLYTYDVFAAWPCCRDRFTCIACGRCMVGDTRFASDGQSVPNTAKDCMRTEKDNVKTSEPQNLRLPFPFFSQYSQLITCPFCAKVDYHFVKGFDQQFLVIPKPQLPSRSAEPSHLDSGKRAD